MGGALLEGVLREKVFPPSRILVADVRQDFLKDLQRRYGVTPCPTQDLIARSDTIVLAVKPQQMGEVLHLFRGRAKKDAVVVSIAAGVTTRRLRRETGLRRIVRVMPNLPMKVGAGVIAWSAGRGGTACEVLVNRLFAPCGIVLRVPESRMDAVTAISGSGPGYLFFLAEIIEALWRAHGLPARAGRKVAAQIFLGAGRLMQETGEAAGALRRKVSSPGGTTLAGLAVLEQRGVAEIFREAVAAAAKRSRELSR